jgi:hypothetical protein
VRLRSTLRVSVKVASAIPIAIAPTPYGQTVGGERGLRLVMRYVDSCRGEER